MTTAAGSIRVVVAHDATLACVVEPTLVRVVGLPALSDVAEVGISEGSSVALVGSPARLVVVAPTGAVHVVDPRGPYAIGELEVPRGSTVRAVSGSHVLIASRADATMISVEVAPSFARFPIRAAALAAAGPSVADHFVLEIDGVLEEWSAPDRAPVRRFRLDRPVETTHVAASTRYLWFVARDAPDRLTVVALAGPSAPRTIELAEPVASATGDGARIAWIGARTGALHVTTLATRETTTLAPNDTLAVAWCGSDLVRVTPERVELVTRDGTRGAPRQRAAPPELEQPRTRDSADPLVASYEWRDAIATWTRAVVRGAHADPPLLAACVLHDVCAQLGLDHARHVIWLLYGARLCGLDGLAPADLVEVCPQRWADALGQTALARSGAIVWERDRVHLAPEVKAALDELAPLPENLCRGDKPR